MTEQAIITNYIYLLQEREFIKTKESIYKIGRTKKENHKRFNQYPKGSILLFQMICNNCVKVETDLIEQFKKKFKHRKDIGNEYFEGNYRLMIDFIYTTIKNEKYDAGSIVECKIETTKQEIPPSSDDVLQTFIDKYCDITDSTNKVSTSDFIKAYQSFIKDISNTVNLKLPSCVTIGKQMVSKGFKAGKYNHTRHYFGIKLKPIGEVTDLSTVPIDETENRQDDDILEDESEDDQFDVICEKISKIFPDYENDGSFYGSKKYVKLEFINDNYVFYYITPYFLENYPYHFDRNDKISEESVISKHIINKNVADELQYFHELINKEIIIVGEIYNINSVIFTDKINRTKFNINIENYKDFKKLHLKAGIYDEFNTDIFGNTGEIIRQLFQCNMLINNYLYATLAGDSKTNIYEKFKKVKNMEAFKIDIGIDDYKIITVFKINDKYYDYDTYLRKHIPYVVQQTMGDNFYLLNRDHEYIGLTKKQIEIKVKKTHYLFDYLFEPPCDHLLLLLTNYKKLIKEKHLKQCLTVNEFTKNLLSLHN
jgi:hypothetical protein